MTHFKEHLRRYMGARFGEPPKGLVEKLGEMVNVNDPKCYRHVQKALKQLGHKNLYKEIFTLIYSLGGKRPYIDNHIFDNCVTDFMWLQAQFAQLRKNEATKRKNMPSMYVLMDILLKRNGHQPFYQLPYLKDEILQSKVIELFEILDGEHL